MNHLLEAALHYHAKGLSVIPAHSILKDGSCDCGSKACSAKGKHPRLNWKNQTIERLNEDDLRLWWKRAPNSNVGIVTGDISQIIVIDIDGEKGLKSMRSIGLALKDMPLTPTVKTGGGGYHLYYRYVKGAAKTRVNVLNKVDIRSDGGFVVAPPSLHSSGRTYKWIPKRGIDDIPIADFDFSLLIKPDSPIIRKDSKWYNEILKGVGEGSRNESATKLAGRYANMGMSQEEIHMMVSTWNQLNKPPLSEDELITTIESIYSKENVSIDRSSSLESISDILKIKLISVKRIMCDSDTPSIMLEFDKGICTISMASLLSPGKFQQEIASAINEVVKRLSSKTHPTHEYLSKMILRAAEIHEADQEATDIGETLQLITDYVQSQISIPTITKKEDKPQAGPFIYGDHIWIRLMYLVQRSAIRWGVKISVKTLSVRLRRMSLIKEEFGGDPFWGISVDDVKWRYDEGV